jgi:hypothetical protein
MISFPGGLAVDVHQVAADLVGVAADDVDRAQLVEFGVADLGGDRRGRAVRDDSRAAARSAVRPGLATAVTGSAVTSSDRLCFQGVKGRLAEVVVGLQGPVWPWQVTQRAQ